MGFIRDNDRGLEFTDGDVRGVWDQGLDPKERGLLERFDYIVGTKLDEIEASITALPYVALPGYIAPDVIEILEHDLGLPEENLNFSVHLKRLLLESVVQLYRIKGTAASFEIIFNLFGLDGELVEIEPVEACRQASLGIIGCGLGLEELLDPFQCREDIPSTDPGCDLSNEIANATYDNDYLYDGFYVDVCGDRSPLIYDTFKLDLQSCLPVPDVGTCYCSQFFLCLDPATLVNLSEEVVESILNLIEIIRPINALFIGFVACPDLIEDSYGGATDSVSITIVPGIIEEDYGDPGVIYDSVDDYDDSHDHDDYGIPGDSVTVT